MQVLRVLLLILAVAFISFGCGDGDGNGGSGSFDWSCIDAPTYNIDNSTWIVQDTSCNSSTCPECSLNAFTADVNMTGANAFTFFVRDTGQTHNGRICGNSIAITGNSNHEPDCDLGTQINIVGALSSSSSGSATSSWTCNWAGGSCSGTSSSIFTRQ